MKVRNSEIQPRLAYTLIKLKIVISKWKVSKMTKWDNTDMIYDKNYGTFTRKCKINDVLKNYHDSM